MYTKTSSIVGIFYKKSQIVIRDYVVPIIDTLKASNQSFVQIMFSIFGRFHDFVINEYVYVT